MQLTLPSVQYWHFLRLWFIELLALKIIFSIEFEKFENAQFELIVQKWSKKF